MNKKKAFEEFGITQKNEVWSWAGMTDDKKLVALTIWTDQKEWDKKNKIYTTSTFNQNNEIWKDSLGNLERIEIIKHCINNLDSKFRVIFIVPKKPGIIEERRECKDAMPFHRAWFKITNFDKETGEFSSEVIRD